jgi:apolipoprotein N-acyltransferase
LDEEIKEDSRGKKSMGAAFGAGLLLNIAILFLWTDTPNDAIALLTGIYPVFSFEDRVLKYPLAMFFIALFCWRAVTLHRKRLISMSMQFWCLFHAAILGVVWVFIALSFMRSSFIPSISGS